jgi:hypothetical protein
MVGDFMARAVAGASATVATIHTHTRAPGQGARDGVGRVRAPGDVVAPKRLAAAVTRRGGARPAQKTGALR